MPNITIFKIVDDQTQTFFGTKQTNSNLAILLFAFLLFFRRCAQ